MGYLNSRKYVVDILQDYVVLFTSNTLYYFMTMKVIHLYLKGGNLCIQPVNRPNLPNAGALNTLKKKN